MKRKILLYGNYFIDFYSKQDDKTKRRIDFVLDLVRNIDRVPIKFLKFLEGTDGLYEIRVSVGNNNIRIFSFFEEDQAIILLTGFLKKTNKTPKKELERATKLKAEYFIEKMKRN